MSGARRNILLVCSIAGMLFAGYLSGVKLFSGTCAFNESCPFFLGYPACYFGFVMFLLLTLASIAHAFCEKNAMRALAVIRVVSFFGIFFAGYYTFDELPRLFLEGLSAYVFGLPTCALGLVFYTLIFALSFVRREPSAS